MHGLHTHRSLVAKPGAVSHVREVVGDMRFATAPLHPCIHFSCWSRAGCSATCNVHRRPLQVAVPVPVPVPVSGKWVAVVRAEKKNRPSAVHSAIWLRLRPHRRSADGTRRTDVIRVACNRGTPPAADGKVRARDKLHYFIYSLS